MSSARQADASIGRGVPVVTDDPSVLTSCDSIDLILEVTGTVAAGARVVLEAISYGKHVVMVRCTNSNGVTQPSAPVWNPAGYLNNTIETTHVVAA